MPIGKLETFDLTSKQWPAYIRRVQQYMVLNEVKNELKVPLLITVVGDATYALMCDLCSPTLPEDTTFEELVKLVTEHLEPQRSEIAERHVFRLRRQRVGEPLAEYLQNLKHLASTCSFGTSLEENLRDQFVSGLANEAMRSRIFAEKNIQYKEAVELALALEAAEKHAEVSGAAVAPASTSGSGGGGGDVGEGLHHASARRERRGPGAGGGAAAARGGTARGNQTQCWRCGKAHRPEKCKYMHYNCDECNTRGHLKVMCGKGRDQAGRQFGRQNYMDEESDEDLFNIQVSPQGNKPYFITLNVDGQDVVCEIDTGSRISAINEDFFKQKFAHKIIKPNDSFFRCYSGSPIESLGYLSVDVVLNGMRATNLPLYVIKNGGRPLLGREWIRALKVNQITINEIVEEDRLVTQLCSEFPEVFTDKLGTCKKGIQLQLTDSDPIYVRARPVPLALRERIERELERLERDGTLCRVDHSDYGTPIVPVVKQSGELRICGDYKVTINPKLKRDYYPLPRIEELFANLSGGEQYTKLDLRHAYEQCLLTEDSQPYTAITTHVGTFVYRRTPYGLSCIPEKFQKLMEETLRGIPNCVVFLDDICVTGPNKQAHMRNLRAVLERLRTMGMTLKLSKCKFLQDKVNYLGFIINKDGLRPDPAKLEAISNAPEPKDVSQLKSFLGMLNYYGKFIPNLSTLLHPLHVLLGAGVEWKWDSACKQAFLEAKQALLGKRVLAHYEEGRELVLAVDSSAYGLGAVLAHRYEDSSERPVSCASRTLNVHERNYSQLDKEALAIYYGVTKHHQYLFGRRFTLRTDHKPLSYIFGNKSGIPQTAASRLQRWAARLAAYDFSVEFVRSVDNGPADALSRLPLPCEGRASEAVSYVQLVEDSLPVSFKEVARETQKDSVLNRIYGYVLFGWPSVTSCEDEKAYFSRKSDLFVDMGCLVYKYRVVIPLAIRKRVLDELHEGHLGIHKMKNISRHYVYWPGIDGDIEAVCRACSACRAVRDAPPHAPLHPWEYPLNPWSRLHADFADCDGKRYLIVVDSHSKWIEAILMKNTDARATILVFRSIFARFGFPEQLVTDNGPPFFSNEFKMFCIENCIKHVTSAPYRPQGNGAAENAVKTIKKAIKRALHEGVDVTIALNTFLFQYRNCEHATTGVSPAVALMRRRLRGRLDALRPDRAAGVRAAQERQVTTAGGTPRSVNVGDVVFARDYTLRGEKWSEGRVKSQTGPVSYTVDMGQGIEWRRHVDQIMPANRNRYSLSRASVCNPDEQMNARANTPEAGADEAFEDASDGEVQAAPEQPLTEHLPTSSGVFTSPVDASTAPPPGASARALRAWNRAQKSS
ncbi:uncharacterized protein K02A2.6-like [Cydia pomonella]|uniref:uncharacterized protein K02A2.6-like n=1 Tax=Cydia pomonella TaxID=82600 RepID=UPI002ADDC5FE|nr:uncharacterized protein K02A2.6-like [Cydia pomonella]